MKTTMVGQHAEAAVSDFLKRQGWQIVGRNWKTKVCEIDIVAKKDGIVYFIEVKYRSSEAQGDGLAYITDRKLNRLHFAARIWNQQNNWDGDYRIMAAAVSEDAKDIQLVELD